MEGAPTQWALRFYWEWGQDTSLGQWPRACRMKLLGDAEDASQPYSAAWRQLQRRQMVTWIRLRV